MKKLFCISILYLTFITIGTAQQTTLYNQTNHSIAYIDYEEEATIFLWDGTPVAFLNEDDDYLQIIGFNGKLLGWYKDGHVYDKAGKVVGSRHKRRISGITPRAGMKRMQRITPIRPIVPISPIVKPRFQDDREDNWSLMPLDEFLENGER
ncbi:MAG: hypothetical protein MK212_01155 [Saprospiraceae bacterium]|nr:hypothetical protein [Saprospiraceae bacterium]